ncbi:hypothetical protein FACS1894187_22630 [Synergistales bacterium]|nr:hypothetical protein FACS1894187_22630 [Synergistales bacterium]
MFCQKCGTELLEGSGICPKCGAKGEAVRVAGGKNPDTYARLIIVAPVLAGIVGYFSPPQYGLHIGIAGAVIMLILALFDTSSLNREKKFGYISMDFAIVILYPVYFFNRARRLKKGWNYFVISTVLCILLMVPSFVAISRNSGFNDYVSAVNSISATESSIIEKYASVMGENYTNDMRVQGALEEIIPKSRNFIAALKRISPDEKNCAAFMNCGFQLGMPN